MSAPAAAEREWTWRGWLSLIAAIFCAQWLLVALTTAPRAALRAPAGGPYAALDAPPRIELAGSAIDRTADDLRQLTLDPVLLVWPSARGFSGRVWEDRGRVEPEFEGWRDPSSGLEPTAAQFAARAASIDLGPAFAGLLLASKPPPAIEVPSAGSAPVRTQSRAEMRGELARWRLTTPVQVPGWPAAEVLQPTVIEAVVTREGWVFSTRVIAGSGSREADAHAQALLRGARFEPPSGDAVGAGQGVIGQWVVRWQTLPLEAR